MVFSMLTAPPENLLETTVIVMASTKTATDELTKPTGSSHWRVAWAAVSRRVNVNVSTVWWSTHASPVHRSIMTAPVMASTVTVMDGPMRVTNRVSRPAVSERALVQVKPVV